MIHDYIPIDVDAMPYQQLVNLDDDSYNFYFYYNPVSDDFMVDLSDYDGNLIKSGEPIVLNQPLFRNINDDRLPSDTIIPLDETGTEKEVNESNLGVNVQLCLDNLDDDGDANE